MTDQHYWIAFFAGFASASAVACVVVAGLLVLRKRTARAAFMAGREQMQAEFAISHVRFAPDLMREVMQRRDAAQTRVLRDLAERDDERRVASWRISGPRAG